VVVGAGRAEAQSIDPMVSKDAVMRKGFHSDRGYFSPLPFEHFDPVNGNLVLSFVDLELPGPAGRTLRFTRTYNAQTREPNQTSHWTFGLEGLVMRVKDKPLVTPPYAYNGTIGPMLQDTPLLYTSDGGIHPTVYLQTPVPSSPTTLHHVTSAEFVRYNRATGTMQYPDGLVAHFRSGFDSETGAVVGDGRVDLLRDQYGNEVTFSYEGDFVIVRQFFGGDPERVVTLELNAQGLPVEMIYAPGGGSPSRAWSYDYVTNGALTELSSVTPANLTGEAWAYDYDQGLLSGVHTPQDGTVGYGYEYRTVQVGPLPTDVESFTILTSRTSSDSPGTPWAIDMVFDPEKGFSYETEVTTPLGTVVKYEHAQVSGGPPGRVLSGGVRLIDFSVRGASSETPLETEHREYTMVSTVYHTASSWWGSTELLSRAVTRAERTYLTTTEYEPNPILYGDFHRPRKVIETSPDGMRTSEYSYFHLGSAIGSTLFLVGRPSTESVSVNVGSVDTWGRSWQYFTPGEDPVRSLKQTTEWSQSSPILYTGIPTSYTYDDFGNVESVSVGIDAPTFYGNRYGRVSEIRTPLHTTQRVINPDGTVASETQAGRTTTYQYDQLGRIVELQPPGGTTKTETIYDPAGHWVRVVRGPDFTETTLDGFGRPIGTVDARNVHTTTLYDAEGRVVQQSLPFTPGVGVGEIRTTTTYDALGRVLERIHPGVGAAPPRVTYNYGPGTVTIWDENDNPSTQMWQAFGNPDDGRLVSVTDAANQTWTYTYDALDHLLAVRAPDDPSLPSRRWTYTLKNRLATETHPESGKVMYDTYDSSGRLKQKTDARGTVFDLTYDANGRLASLTAGNRRTLFGYEGGSDRREWASVGYLDAPQATVVNPIDTRFWYDAAGRLAGRQDTIDGRTFTTWQTFDTLDNVITTTYPALEVAARRQIGFLYDTTGRQLLEVSDRGAVRNYASNFTYHPSGAVRSYHAGNNVVTTIDYDPYRYWVTSITAGPLALGYTDYDAVGNLKTLTDNRSGHTQTFTYDALNRLTTATGAYGSQVFDYDGHGNRVTVPGYATYTYDAATKRLIDQNGIPFTYDANGNLTTQPSAAYSYAVDNLLETAIVNGVPTFYRYDADGWRIAKTSGGVTTYFLRGTGNQLLTEWTSPGPAGTTKDYIYAGSRLISAVETLNVASASLPGGVLVVGGAPATVALPTGQDARYTFAGTAGQMVEARLTSATPLNCEWTLALLSPTGATLDSATPCSGTTITISVTLGTSGLYTLLVHPIGTASGTVTVVLNNATSGAATISGVSPTIGTPGTAVTVSGAGLAPVASLRFNVTEALASGSATSLATTVPVGATSGRVSVTTPLGTASSAADFFVPPSPYTAAAVGYTGRLALGTAQTVTITTAGQVGLLVFDRVAGQRFVTTLLNRTFAPYFHVTIYRPDGVPLYESGAYYAGTSMAGVDTLTAPLTGTYTLLIKPTATGTGATTVTVRDVPLDWTGAITPTGTPVTVGPVTYGQNAQLTFTGYLGQRAALVVDAKTTPMVSLTLQAPDGSTVWYGPLYNPGEYTVVTLPLTGAYRLHFDPYFLSEIASASVTFRVYDVPADVQLSATPGTPLPVPITAPYQNAYVAIAGTTNQRMSGQFSSSSFATNSIAGHVTTPSGSTLYSIFTANAGTFMDVKTFTQTGNHSLFLNPSATSTGSITFTLFDVPADPAPALTVNDPAVTVTTTTPGQNAEPTFVGATGQVVTVRLTGNTLGSVTVTLIRPNGTTQATTVSAATSFTLPSQTLTAGGTYKVRINPSGATTGSIGVQVTTP
jgi:YD repeat-containing protein